MKTIIYVQVKKLNLAIISCCCTMIPVAWLFICYAGAYEEGIKVTAAKPLRGGMLLVTFSTGEKRLFDTTKLRGQAFAPLADEEVFRHPVIFHGVITWQDGAIDIAPETVYRQSYAYDDLAS